MISNFNRWSFRQRCALGFLSCAALLGYAFFVQFKQDIQPCNFCILQRVAFAALGLIFAIGAVINARGVVRQGLVALALIAAAAGLAVSLRHVWVQLYPPPMAGCAASLGFLMETMPVGSVLRKVMTASGDCSNIDWKFLGLTMPAWCALWFAGLGVWAWLGLRTPVRGRDLHVPFSG